MRSNTNRFSLTLLHIDDDSNDRFLLRQAIESTSALFDYHGVDSLPGAVDYFGFLPRLNAAPHKPRPEVVLLDYDLGDQCGTDFLYWLRVQHRNTRTPVIIYSGSGGDRQVGDCYAFGANYFLRKAESFPRTRVVAYALRACFTRPFPDFKFLAHLPESVPDPRLAAQIAA